MATNGSLKAGAIGAVLLALVAIFAFVNGLPWERKGAAAEVEQRVVRELDAIKRAMDRMDEKLDRALRRP